LFIRILTNHDLLPVSSRVGTPTRRFYIVILVASCKGSFLSRSAACFPFLFFSGRIGSTVYADRSYGPFVPSSLCAVSLNQTVLSIVLVVSDSSSSPFVVANRAPHYNPGKASTSFSCLSAFTYAFTPLSPLPLIIWLSTHANQHNGTLDEPLNSLSVPRSN